MQWSSTVVRRAKGALVLAAAASSLCACAQMGSGSGIDTAKIKLEDLDGGLEVASITDAHRPDLASPIAKICAYPGGKQVLDTDLPGLTGRPEYMFFSGMSLKKLQVMSKGQLKDEDLAKVDADLRRLP